MYFWVIKGMFYFKLLFHHVIIIIVIQLSCPSESFIHLLDLIDLIATVIFSSNLICFPGIFLIQIIEPCGG